MLEKYFEKENFKFKHGLIIETGCARYASNQYRFSRDLSPIVPGTFIFSKMADENNIKFICVDWNPDMIEIAKREITSDNTEFVCAASHDYFTHLVSENVVADFIYLDSSNDRHYILKEFKLALQMVDLGSVICIDDYSAEKCILIEEYLKSVNLPYEVDELIVGTYPKMYVKITPEIVAEVKKSFDNFYNQYDWKKLNIEFRENQYQYEHAMCYINIGVDE